jgi:hypothetical protein
MSSANPLFWDPMKYAGQVLRDLDHGLSAQRFLWGGPPWRKEEEPTERFIDSLAAQMAVWMAGYARVTLVLNLNSKI